MDIQLVARATVLPDKSAATALGRNSDASAQSPQLTCTLDVQLVERATRLADESAVTVAERNWDSSAQSHQLLVQLVGRATVLASQLHAREECLWSAFWLLSGICVFLASALAGSWAALGGGFLLRVATLFT